MKKSILTIIAVFVIISLHAEESNTLFENGKEEALLTDKLVYYGLDFSNFHLCNEFKMKQGTYLFNVYIPVWIEKFNEVYGGKRLEKQFKADNFIYNPESFQQDQYNKIESKNVVIAKTNPLNADRLQQIVSDYTLREESGVGFTIVLEEYNKPDELVSAVFTFFDIKTKKVLYAYRDFGKPSGMGMEVHWRAGLIDVMHEYMLKEYYFEKKSVTKKYKKQNKEY